MQLINFPYTTTNRLVKYSKLVTKAIASFNRDYASTNWDYTSIDRNSASKIGTIAHDPNYGLPPNEDRLEYWDTSKKAITFGRYLLFTQKKENGRVIPFWTGLSSTQEQVGIEFIIWFKKKNLPTDYIKKFEDLEKLENLCHQESSDGNEIWIPMKDIDLKNLCTSCAYRRRQILKKFWFDVLGVLQ
jgi:hypothetical protein